MHIPSSFIPSYSVPLVRASEPKNVWIYFENNKQDFWCICMNICILIDSIEHLFVMNTEHWTLSTKYRLLNCELRIIFEKRIEEKKQTFATDKIWWSVTNVAFSSTKVEGEMNTYTMSLKWTYRWHWEKCSSFSN